MKLMKQSQISNWLKGVVIILGIMGLIFFGGFTWYAFVMQKENPSNLSWLYVFFMWYVAVLCYMVLYLFWNVCNEIGRDNSFSLENAKYFHHMCNCGVLAMIGFIVRFLFFLLVVKENFYPWYMVIVAGEVIVSGLFSVICEALSRLIANAYEVKQENDLTI